MLTVVVPDTFLSNASAPAIGASDIFISGDVGLFKYWVVDSFCLVDVSVVDDGVVEDDPV